MADDKLAQEFYGLSIENYNKVYRSLITNENGCSLITPSNIGEEMSNTALTLKLSTGIPELDSLTKGGLKKGVHVIAGFRKCCKSTFSINLIYRALNEGLNVCLLSLEMTKHDVLNILISLHTFELDNKNAKTRDDIETMYVNDRKQYDEYLCSLLSLPGNLIIFTETDIENNLNRKDGTVITTGMYSETNLTYLFNDANKDCFANNGKGVQLLVVDNLNCIRTWNKKTTGETAYTQASNFFRKAANNFGSRSQDNSYGNEPVICLLLCQINRTGGKAAEYEGFYPDSCIAETVNIERDATTVIPIYYSNYIGNYALIKLEASRYCKSMDAPVRIPVNLKYGKIGLPLQVVNVNDDKLQQLKDINRFRLVKCKDAGGKEVFKAIPKSMPLPDGYLEINEEDDYDIY